MPVPKKHHYVPQVYLQRWEDSEKLLWVYNLHTATVAHRNKRNVLYEDYLYSLTLREANLLTMEQKKFFIAPLKEYQVFLDGKELDTSEIVENLPSYDRFQIMKNNGSFVKPRHKAALFDEIINGKNPLIEQKFGAIEQQWKATADFFDEYRHMIIAQEVVLPSADVVMQHCNHLLEFVLATYTRNPYNIIRSIERFETEKSSNIQNTECRRVFETIQLKYLNGEQKLFDMEKYDIHCIFAAPSYHFLTSDNPVCIRPILVENMNFTGIFWFPISPHTLISLSKKNSGDLLSRNLHIYHYLITGESIWTFNKHICENAINIVISSERIEDPRFKFLKN